MKLLFDENLSPRLVELLATEFPQSVHVETLGMRGTTDAALWEYAKNHGFAIVSKDNDFRQRAFVHGAPPKDIWLSIETLVPRTSENSYASVPTGSKHSPTILTNRCWYSKPSGEVAPNNMLHRIGQPFH